VAGAFVTTGPGAGDQARTDQGSEPQALNARFGQFVDGWLGVRQWSTECYDLTCSVCVRMLYVERIIGFLMRRNFQTWLMLKA